MDLYRDINPDDFRRVSAPRYNPCGQEPIHTGHTSKQLRAICRANGVRGYSNQNKAWMASHCFTPRDKYTVKDLRSLCRANGVKGYFNKRKDWLMTHCFTRVSANM
jgi:hypothetical protein